MINNITIMTYNTTTNDVANNNANNDHQNDIISCKVKEKSNDVFNEYW